MKTYSNYFSSDIQRIIGNSLADNISWGMEVVNDSIRYLVSKYYFNERSYTTTTTANTQFYNLPPQVKKLINLTVNIGGVLWSPKECPTRAAWDALNVVSFTQDFPSYFFVYNGQVGVYPTPASSGNMITMNYKTRVKDLSQADYTTGTIAITNGSTTATGTTTSFANYMAEGGWIRLNHSSTNTANGDFKWYEINSITSATALELKAPYEGATVTGASYVLGEVSLLPEDYQDLPLYRMGMIYYTTRFPDPARSKQYSDLWNAGLNMLDEEFGSKTTSVVLPDVSVQIINPNLFTKSLT